MELKAQKREKFGKITASLRRQGLIPAELYGRGLENLHLMLSLKDFNKVYKSAGENTVVTVLIDKEKRPVLIYSVVEDSLNGTPVHVDLYQVKMNEKIQTKVPLQFFGEAPAVKDKNGVLVKTLQELPIESLPGDIPQFVNVDISKLLDIGNSIYVQDLPILKEVKVLVDGRTVVATAKAKLTEEQEAALAAAGSVETVKVESEEKKAEREAVKTAEGTATATPAEEAKKE